MRCEEKRSSVNKEGQDDRAPAPRGVTKAAREVTPDWRRDSSAELAVRAWGRGRVSEGTARVAEAGGGLLRVSVPAPPGQGCRGSERSREATQSPRTLRAVAFPLHDRKPVRVLSRGMTYVSKDRYSGWVQSRLQRGKGRNREIS